MMIETIIEDSCVYCSKSLSGLNDFNRKMHIETCKVRKLVDANLGDPNDLQLENYIVVGDHCSYCFRSFQDFKSEFNKRLHIKCCKIKKETYDEKNNGAFNNGEHCVFCTKPLANLNDFNKRMHRDNCKIRKSIENSGSPNMGKKGQKDENLIKLGIELGESCAYCSKSFINLSDFNKKLHFEYCKFKKRKMAKMDISLSGCLNMSIGSINPNINTENSVALNNSMDSSLNNVILNSQLILNTPNNQNNNNSNSQNMDDLNDPCNIGKLDLGESCLFCSRSLVNLSNFNKRIHIETCKIKTLKKATSKLRRSSSAKTASPRKRQPKKEKIDTANSQINNLYINQNINKTLTLELMGSNLGNLVNLNVDQQQLLSSINIQNNNIQNNDNTQNNSINENNNGNNNNPNNSNQNINNILPVNVINNVNNGSNSNIIQLQQFQLQQNNQQLQGHHQNNISQNQQGLQTNILQLPLTISSNNGMSQFDSLVASLNNSNTLNLTQMQQLNNQLNTQMNNQINQQNNIQQNISQIKIDPNGRYNQNSDGICF